MRLERGSAGVEAAFEMLLEEVEVEVGFVKRDGAAAFEAGNFDEARDALQRADAITAFRARVSDLRADWERIVPQQEATPVERRNLGRLAKGQRTREDAFYIPILTALNEMGGGGRMRDVMDAIEPMVRPLLRPHDHEPLPSDPDQPRWRNTAQWARLHLVKEGLMKKDSKHGIWEISPAGSRAVRDAA